MNNLKKIAKMIEKELGHTNGWKIPDEEYSAKCHLLASKIVSQMQPQDKLANVDFNLIAGMYAVLQSQLSCIVNYVAGNDKLANKIAEEITPKIKRLNKEIEKRLSV